VARFYVLALLFIVGGCGLAPDNDRSAENPGAVPTETDPAETDPTGTNPTGTNSTETPAREQLSIPLSLYVVAADGGSGTSSRTEPELTEISARMNKIWAQADIRFDPIVVNTITAPSEVLDGIDQLDASRFLQQAGSSFAVPDPGMLNGFYVSRAGRVNGFAPVGQKVFFVADEPTVHDERVSSHEIGHIFGLHHDPRDQENLMFGGTNGTTLTARQQQIARYVAEGILNGLR